jgi:hypothetical protein
MCKLDIGEPALDSITKLRFIPLLLFSDTWVGIHFVTLS